MSVLAEELICSRCRTKKPIGDFYPRPSRPRLVSSECKSCHKGTSRYRDSEYRRSETLKRRYGLTTEDYDELYQAQGGACALCGGHSNGRGRLAVDHDHESGAIRGLLCFTCNTALGRLERIGLDRVSRYARLDELLAIEQTQEALF